MKYYKRNLGDYAGATRHLSMLEHGAYSLLMDTYYVTEKPLPADFSRLCRLLGVRSKQEKLAVESVLADFFVKSDDGWRQERCDAEIANAQEFGEEREERANNEKERQRRHRDRRKQLFAELHEHGIVPAWDASTSRLRELLSQATGNPVTPDVTDDVTLPVTLPVTPPVTPATAIDIKQETVLKKNTNTQPLPFPAGMVVIERCAAKAAKADASAFHRDFLAELIDEGWSAHAEHAVPDRGDGRSGRIDVLVTSPLSVGIELDRKSVRSKSIVKLSAIDGHRVAILRDATSHPPVTGLDAIICCGVETSRVNAEGFAEFYAKYPRHVARAAAERAWSKIDPDEPLRERIMAALVHNGFDYREDGRFIPYPASWLNAQRWDDEPTLLLDEVAEQVNRV